MVVKLYFTDELNEWEVPHKPTKDSKSLSIGLIDAFNEPIWMQFEDLPALHNLINKLQATADYMEKKMEVENSEKKVSNVCIGCPDADDCDYKWML